MPKKQIKRSPVSVKSRMHHHVKQVVVPHRGNQYRPHAIRRYGVAIIVTAVVVVQMISSGFATGNILGVEAQITPSGLLGATNRARTGQGERPLKLNTALMQAARLKVQNMFADQYWAHDAPDGTTPWHWFATAGYSYAEAGENLAKNFTTSDATVAAWLASPAHRANVLKSSYQDVGFAVMDGMLDGSHATIVVALYGEPEAAAVQGDTVTSAAHLGGLSLVTRFGLMLQSLTPATIGSLVLLIAAADIALVAHMYRNKLPLQLRRSWYRHHGLYKAIGFTSIAIMVIVMYGSIGQI